MLILPVSITFFQRAYSFCWKAANSAGVLTTISKPMEVNWSLTFGLFRASAKAAWAFSRTAGGRPLGATMACQEVTSTLGTPASAMVGTSGSTGERLALVTARGRILPPLMYCSTEFTFWNEASTWPPIRSVWAGAPPL